MSTTPIETWVGADLSQIGPIYPFVGTEFAFFIIGMVIWISFHVIQLKIEKKAFAADEAAAKSPERLQKVFAEEAAE